MLRKEKSWNNWRDTKIDPDDFNNEPQSGIIINKNVSRYNWSHFSNNKTYIRLHDPRGFEFEISPENLIGILMNGDCSKRVLDGEFVYSWSGTDLVLLPCNSEEYQKSLEFTKLQSNKIGVKDLIPGFSYGTKREKDVIYMGKFDWYTRVPVHEEDISRDNTPLYKIQRINIVKYNQICKKQHIFYINGIMQTKSSLDFLSHKNGDEPVTNYAELMDDLNSNIHISPIVDIEEEFYEFKPIIGKTLYYGDGLLNPAHIILSPDNHGYYDNLILSCPRVYNRDSGEYCIDFNNFRFELHTRASIIFDLKDNRIKTKYTSNTSKYVECSAQQLNSQFKFVKIFAKMKNGKRVEIVASPYGGSIGSILFY